MEIKRRILKIFSLLLLFILSSTKLFSFSGSPSQYIFKQLTVEQGLSQNSVYAILQDHRGFMWFGTKDGLNRYDGYTFTVFNHNPNDSSSLADNFITKLYEDRLGRMWIGTQNGGLHLYDRMHEKFIRVPFFAQFELGAPAGMINTIIEDNSGNIYAGTNGYGIVRISLKEKNEFAIKVFRNNPADPFSIADDIVTSIFFDGERTLWVGTGGNLQSVDLGMPEQKFITHNVYNDTGKDMFNILCFFKDSKKRIWFSTLTGIYRYDDRSKEFIFYHIPGGGIKAISTIVRTICEDDKGIFWLGTFNSVFRFDPDRNIFEHVSTHLNSQLNSGIVCIYKDRSGMLWFGSNGEGIFSYNPNVARFQSYTKKTLELEGWDNRSVRCLFEDSEGKLWVSTYGGLYVSGKDRQDYHLVPHISDPVIRDIIQSMDGTLWFASLTGVVRTDINGKILQTFLHKVRDQKDLQSRFTAAVYEDREGNIWSIIPGILSKLDKQKGRWIQYEFRQYDKSINDVTPAAMYQDDLGDLWFTSEEGLHRFNVKGKKFSHYMRGVIGEQGLNYNVTLSLCPDPIEPKKYLWIGTAGGGLNRLEYATGKFTHVTEADGLPNNVVYGILNDKKGNLWISTNKGLARYNPLEKTVKKYFSTEGLQSNEYNSGAYFKNKEGECFFGGVNGFDIFNPEEVNEHSHLPNVVLTEIQLFNKPIHIGDETGILQRSVPETDQITLSYEQNVISLMFAALDFAISEKNKYKYILEGFDSKWVTTETKRTATYTNLDPGTYTFRVLGSNSDGVWNTKGASLTITVLPPFWMTWWFRTIAVVVLLAIVTFIYVRRISVLKKEQLQHELFTRKLIEQQESERKRIAGELHDSLGQTLLVIKNRALMGLNASTEDTKPKKHLDEISASATEAINEVREMAYRLRPYQLDRIGITKAIKTMVDKISANSNIAFSTSLDPLDGMFKREDEINVYRIVQESLSNIVRHSQATTASVHITRNKDLCSITVEDNGIGLKKQNGTAVNSPRYGFGMTGMEERVRMLKGTMSVQSPAGGGTILRFEIPIIMKQ